MEATAGARWGRRGGGRPPRAHRLHRLGPLDHMHPHLPQAVCHPALERSRAPRGCPEIPRRDGRERADGHDAAACRGRRWDLPVRQWNARWDHRNALDA
eukprot:7493398-Alexandrium_andersonii.AAC.1